MRLAALADMHPNLPAPQLSDLEREEVVARAVQDDLAGAARTGRRRALPRRDPVVPPLGAVTDAAELEQLRGA